MSDRLSICEMCRNFPGEYNFCPITARCCRDDYLYESCSDFEQKALPTVFQQITVSPEVLAKELITTSYDEFKDCTVYWAWLGNGRREAYYSEAEAIAATVAKLKEVEK